MEALLTQIGIDLFDKIFQSRASYGLWVQALPALNDTRIEIITDVQGATIPWELICNPDTLQPLALGAASFIRTYNQRLQCHLGYPRPIRGVPYAYSLPSAAQREMRMCRSDQ